MPSLSSVRFEVYASDRGTEGLAWRWCLKDISGSVLASSSRTYRSREEALEDVDLIRTAGSAEIRG